MFPEKVSPTPKLNDIFERGLQNFLMQAEAELRAEGFDEAQISSFSERFKGRFISEYQSLSKFKETPKNLQEYLDDTLHLTMSDLQNGNLANSLWGWRAGEALEHLEKKETGQGNDNVVELRT